MGILVRVAGRIARLVARSPALGTFWRNQVGDESLRRSVVVY